MAPPIARLCQHQRHGKRVGEMDAVPREGNAQSALHPIDADRLVGGQPVADGQLIHRARQAADARLTPLAVIKFLPVARPRLRDRSAREKGVAAIPGLSAIAQAIGVIKLVLAFDHGRTAVAGALAYGRRVRSGDDRPRDLPGEPIVGRRGECHRGVRLSLRIIAGGLVVNPAEQRFALQLHMLDPLAAGRRTARRSRFQHGHRRATHAVRLLAVDGERAAERGETAISSVGKLEFGEPAVGDGARPAGHVGHADAHANAARYVDIVSGHDILHGRWSGEEREQRQSYDACGFRHAHFPYAMPFAAALPC